MSSKVNKRLRKELMANQTQSQTQPQNLPQQQIRGEIHSGPIPDPETLERYSGAGPNFPERIMQMAEAHNAADVAAKNRISLSNLIVPIIGQVFTLILGAGGILACIYLAKAGYTGPAIAAMAGSFSPMVIGALKNLRGKK